MALARDIPWSSRTPPKLLRHWLCVGLIPAVFLSFSEARGQEDGVARQQLDRVLAVLRQQQAAASTACIDAMTQVHATEQQVKEHENDTGEHPDLDIARDVLDSDYQNGEVICGADAERVCHGAHDTRLIKPCGALHRDPS